VVSAGQQAKHWEHYAAAEVTREEKVRILSEFTSVSGLHRKSAIRVLNAEAESEPSMKRAGRPRLYDQAVQQALVTLWEASDRVCGKRLKALLPVLLAALEKHGHMAVDPAVKTNGMHPCGCSPLIGASVRAPHS